MKNFLRLLLFLNFSAFIAARPSFRFEGDDPDSGTDQEQSQPSPTGESNGGPELSTGPTKSADSIPAPSPGPSDPPQPSAAGTTTVARTKQGPNEPPVPGRCVLILGFMEHARDRHGNRKASVWLDIFNEHGRKLDNLKWGKSGDKKISEIQQIDDGGVSVQDILAKRRGDVLYINWHHGDREQDDKVSQLNLRNTANDSKHKGHYTSEEDTSDDDIPSYLHHNHHGSTDGYSNSNSDTHHSHTGNDHGDHDSNGVPDHDAPMGSEDDTGHLEFEYTFGLDNDDIDPLHWTDRTEDLRCLRGEHIRREGVVDRFRMDTCFFDCTLLNGSDP